jgi:Protein of unknown function (DUF3712)
VILTLLHSILVAIPHIAQQKINEATLSIEGISILQTQTTSYQLGINSTIRSDGSIHATIKSFNGSMYLEDLQPHTPFSTVLFPESTSDAVVTVNVSQHMDVTNLDAFTTFNTWLLNNETLRVTISGDTFVRVSGIARDYPVTFTKTVTLNGMQRSPSQVLLLLCD